LKQYGNTAAACREAPKASTVRTEMELVEDAVRN
jgi:hypothetical protein